MIVDVSAQIENAKIATKSWADRAGFKAPDAVPENISKQASDIRRILAVSDFGRQARNVHSLCEALIGESIPIPEKKVGVDYEERVPFKIGSVLFPVRSGRVGLVVRVSQSRNAGLRLSNGEIGKYYSQSEVRPATDDEIDQYYREWFGLIVNEADREAPEPEVDDPSF